MCDDFSSKRPFVLLVRQLLRDAQLVPALVGRPAVEPTLQLRLHLGRHRLAAQQVEPRLQLGAPVEDGLPAEILWQDEDHEYKGGEERAVRGAHKVAGNVGAHHNLFQHVKLFVQGTDHIRPRIDVHRLVHATLNVVDVEVMKADCQLPASTQLRAVWHQVRLHLAVLVNQVVDNDLTFRERHPIRQHHHRHLALRVEHRVLIRLQPPNNLGRHNVNLILQPFQIDQHADPRSVV
mmetsp:Transcript_11327/g.20471  ORF Transcript_11327/g.20471 Transcript_11327/m.20471 type:complete len:235 (+) Transcript_11327:200-904(+)